jgi:hypothetical protein
MSAAPENQYSGRTIHESPFFPQSVTTADELDEAILAQLETQDPLAASKVAFQLIHHARITLAIFQELRSK